MHNAYPHDKLFNDPGYILLSEYLQDITHMRQNGPWKLPLGIGDRMQLWLLKCVVGLSWFRDLLYIEHPHPVSPSYSSLLAYLKRHNFYDTITERNMHFRGNYSYYIEKIVPFGKGRTYHMYGQGIAKDRATALSIAIGEILERSISGLFDKNTDILVASPNDILQTHPVVYPPKYHRFLDIQKERRKELRHDPAQKIRWVKGRDLVTNKMTYIPRQMTSWFEENRKKRDVLVNSTTNGAAGYFTKDGAILRGLLEVVQRDGFLVHWLTTTAPDVILNDSLPDHIQEQVREFTSFGISVTLLDVTALSIPSVIAVATNPSGKVPQVIICGGSATTMREAIEGALRELGQGVESFYSASPLPEDAGDTSEPFVSTLNKNSRVSYWRGEERMKDFQWFVSGEKISYEKASRSDISSSNQDADKLAACIVALQHHGKEYHPVVYFPLHPIQQELGFCVVQVYIPKAFPLYLFEGYGTFESDRLVDFVKSTGKNECCLNPHPHMFP